jgi:hypothetical protein
MCHQLRLRLYRLGKPFLQSLRDLLVNLLPGTPQQRPIGRILDEGVLKDIFGPWRPTPLVEQFGLHQLGQSRL